MYECNCSGNLIFRWFKHEIKIKALQNPGSYREIQFYSILQNIITGSDSYYAAHCTGGNSWEIFKKTGFNGTGNNSQLINSIRL